MGKHTQYWLIFSFLFRIQIATLWRWIVRLCDDFSNAIICLAWHSLLLYKKKISNLTKSIHWWKYSWYAVPYQRLDAWSRLNVSRFVTEKEEPTNFQSCRAVNDFHSIGTFSIPIVWRRSCVSSFAKCQFVCVCTAAYTQTNIMMSFKINKWNEMNYCLVLSAIIWFHFYCFTLCGEIKTSCCCCRLVAL